MIFAIIALMMVETVGLVAISDTRAGGTGDTPWPLFHGNVERTGLSIYDTSGNMGNVRWTYRTNGYVFSSPVIGSDGSIYFGSNDYFLYAVDSSGVLRWKYRTGDIVESSPAVAVDGTIYFGSEDHYLYALNPDGNLRWRYTTFGAIDSSPAIAADGTVYVGSADGKLYAVNPSGSLKWSYDTGHNIEFSSPAIAADGTIYIGSYHSLFAVNPGGNLKWSYDTGGSVDYSSPAIGSDGTVYISSSAGLFAVNPTGSLKWEYALSLDSFTSSPAIGSDGTIYAGTVRGYLYAINPNGGLKWKYSTGGAVYSSPAIGSDGTIYFGSDDGYIYALNPDGNPKWEVQTGDDVRSSPAIGSDGSIYVGSYDHNLYVLGNERPPSAPRNLVVDSRGSGYVSLSWDPPLSDGGSAINSYKIYRGTAAGQETYYTYVSGKTTNFTDDSPLLGETDYYYVTALNSGGESDASNEVSVAFPSTTRPSSPQNLTAVSGNGYIDLSWDPPSDNGGSQITNYTIYRGTQSGGEVLLKVVGGSITTYRDDSVDVGHTYYYYITATNDAGESQPSNEVHASPMSRSAAPSSSGGGWFLLLGLLLIAIIVLLILLLMKRRGPAQPVGTMPATNQPPAVQPSQPPAEQPQVPESGGIPTEGQ